MKPSLIEPTHRPSMMTQGKRASEFHRCCIYACILRAMGVSRDDGEVRLSDYMASPSQAHCDWLVGDVDRALAFACAEGEGVASCGDSEIPVPDEVLAMAQELEEAHLPN